MIKKINAKNIFLVGKARQSYAQAERSLIYDAALANFNLVQNPSLSDAIAYVGWDIDSFSASLEARQEKFAGLQIIWVTDEEEVFFFEDVESALNDLVAGFVDCIGCGQRVLASQSYLVNGFWAGECCHSEEKILVA